MDLHISPHDGVPIYLQIVGQVKYLVASGRLAPGEELPAIRVGERPDRDLDQVAAVDPALSELAKPGQCR